MMKRTLAWVGLIFLASIFLSVFVGVLQMRITKGDAYPHYATYRTDPLGASGLYEAFGKIPGVSAQRNLQSLMKIDSLDEASRSIPQDYRYPVSEGIRHRQIDFRVSVPVAGHHSHGLAARRGESCHTQDRDGFE